jgi:DNA-directed RNA polymerase subunit beta'
MKGMPRLRRFSANYNMGFITNNERYNQIIDIWTHINAKLTQTLMKQITADQQGFNSVFMMLDSGARGSKEQIRQLSGMRGLMAKPQKSGSAGSEIIENPILSNFKEGLSVLEYLYLPTVREKVLQIRPLRLQMPVTLQGDLLMFRRM